MKNKFKIEALIVGYVEAENEEEAVKWLEEHAYEFLLKSNRYIEDVEKVENIRKHF